MSTIFTVSRGFKALLLAGGAGTIAFAAPSAAQAQDGASEGEAPIIVTGSRIQRRDFESNSPIVTIDESFLKESSTAALEVNLNRLPQFTPAQTPTLGGDIQPTATNTPGAATISLRGIGANRNLVLLDGRRATPSNASGVTDITTIPSAAIQRIESISGGASATYGADAIAGVTNFILKKDFVGLELDGQASMSQSGDGFEYQLSGIMGTDFADGRGNISLAMSVNTRNASYQRDRKWYRDLWADPLVGGSQFFVDRPGVILGNGNPIDPGVFFGIFNQANPADSPFDFVNGTCGAEPAVPNPISNGACSRFDLGGGFVINLTSPIAAGAQGFNIHTNPDGSVWTGTGFYQRGGAYRFQGGDGYKTTAAGNIGQNNENLYLNLPLTRYNAFARGNYELNDWIGVFGQALFSSVSTYTRNEPGPITTGWDVQIPYGNQIYTGNSELGIPSSIISTAQFLPDGVTPNPDYNVTHANYLTGGAYGLNCPAVGGCPTYQVFPVPAELQELLLARQNPDAPFSLSTLMPDDRETFTDVVTFNLMAGFEGYVPGTDWTWELYASHGVSSTFARQTGIYSLMRTRAVLTSPNFGQGLVVRGNPASGGFGASTGVCTSGLNFFNVPAGGFSEDCLEAIRADLKNRSKFRQTIVEFNSSGKLFDLPAGEVRGAIGASYREMDYEFINDTLTTQGRSFLDQALGIYPSGDAFGYIDVKELYAELLIPILSDVPGIQSFNLELGGRMSNYSTTGTSYTYKVVGDWEVTDWLRLRGGFNRAERAPNIGELFLAAQQTFGVNTAGDPCSLANPLSWSANPANANGANVQSVCQILMEQSGNPDADTEYYSGFQNPGTFGFAFPTLVGNANLVPEKANTWTAGVVINSPFTSSALSRLRLSVDWFDIKITDAIGAQTVAAAMQQCFDPALNPLVASDPTGAANTVACQNVPRNQTGQSGNIYTTYTNNGRVHLQGVDVQLDWAADVGPGTLSLNLNANYLIDFKSAALPILPLVDYVGTQGTAENGLNAGGSYEYRFTTNLGYSFGGAYIGLMWQHWPAVEDAAEAMGGVPTATTGAPSYNLFSLNSNYQVNDAVSVRFGINNLLNQSPPLTGENPNYNLSVGGLRGGAIPFAPYDTFGRSFYLGANVKF